MTDIATIDKFLTDLVECDDLNDLAADGGVTVGMVFQQQARWMRTLLARIVIETPPPADPDRCEARRMVAETYRTAGYERNARKAESGAWDEDPVLVAALACIKRGRELAQPVTR
jgi:hypothetical protein